MVNKIIIINGTKYTVRTIHPTNVGYGTIGRKGIEVFGPGHMTSQSSMRFSNMSAFRKHLKLVEKYK